MEYEYAAEAHMRWVGSLGAREERWLIRMPTRLVERGDKVAFEPFGRWHKVMVPRLFRWRAWHDYVYLDASNTRGYVRRETA
jgi:hypothetical protein